MPTSQNSGGITDMTLSEKYSEQCELEEHWGREVGCKAACRNRSACLEAEAAEIVHLCEICHQIAYRGIS